MADDFITKIAFVLFVMEHSKAHRAPHPGRAGGCEKTLAAVRKRAVSADACDKISRFLPIKEHPRREFLFFCASESLVGNRVLVRGTREHLMDSDSIYIVIFFLVILMILLTPPGPGTPLRDAVRSR